MLAAILKNPCLSCTDLLVFWSSPLELFYSVIILALLVGMINRCVASSEGWILELEGRILELEEVHQLLGSLSYLGWSFSSYTLAACLPVSTRVIQINKELLTVSSYWHISFPLTVSSLASVDLFGVHFLSYVLALHFHEPIAFLPAIWILFSRNSTLLLFPVISQLLPCEASLACWEEQPCPRVSIGHSAYCSLVACQAAPKLYFPSSYSIVWGT